MKKNAYNKALLPDNFFAALRKCRRAQRYIAGASLD
ncbi:hypothetical protein FIU96_19315 [Marinobacter sp. THAF39]|nr:hypothetical protein FIV08_19410 [Marinobacter sp. THAF197a]QFT52802.1 hypothetical protein FIU96_19315 [Marinobacter sp. THAF39]